MKTKGKVLNKFLSLAAAVIFSLAFVLMGGGTGIVSAQEGETAGAGGMFDINETDGSWKVFTLPESVTLAENEGVEISFTVDKPLGLTIMASMNPAADYTDPDIAYPYGGLRAFLKAGIGLSHFYTKTEITPIVGGVVGDPLVYSTADVAENVDFAYAGDNRTPGANPWDSWSTPGTTIGADGWTYSQPINFKIIFRADGSSVFMMKNEGDSVWSTLYYVQSGLNVQEGNVQGFTGADTVVEDAGDYTTKAFPSIANIAAKPALAVSGLIELHVSRLSGLKINKLNAEDEVTAALADETADFTMYTGGGNVTPIYDCVNTDGAAIRIAEGEEDSMRFISTFDREGLAALKADSYTVGTVIKGGVYTNEELTVETVGAKVVENTDGCWKESADAFQISAYIYGIEEQYYGTEVSARAYIKYVKDGVTRYIYGDVISKSLSGVAEAALADVSDVQDDVYQYDLGDGTYSPYDKETRTIIAGYIKEA